MEHGSWEWAGFLALVLAMLALDLGVFNRKDHVIRPREALGLVGALDRARARLRRFVWARHGAGSGLEYLTGYVIEKSLSVDNIFVFVVIFGALGIPALYQHRVLFWGIVSRARPARRDDRRRARRCSHRFHWIIYVFGAFLVAHRREALPRARGGSRTPRRAPRSARCAGSSRRPRASTGNRFFTRENGRRARDPALLRARAHRGHRRHLRGRLDPRHLRGDRATPSSSSPRTSSRSWACARSTSCSRAASSSSPT